MESITGYEDELILIELEILHDSYEEGLHMEQLKATAFSMYAPDVEGYFSVVIYIKTESGILLATKQFTRVRYLSTKLCNRQGLEEEEETLSPTVYN